VDGAVTPPLHAAAAPLRILIDLRWMIPGQSGGLEDAAYCFLDQLLSWDNGDALSLIVPSELIDRFRSVVPAHVTLLSRDDMISDLKRGACVLTRGRICGAPLRGDFDIAYSLNGRLHDELRTIPAVVMIADLLHMVHPRLLTPQECEERTRASREAARHAQAIVTISEYSRRSIIELLGVDPSRVVTSYLAVDPIFERVPSSAEREAVLARYDLAGRRYLYLPAQLWPHKNHAPVVAALERLVRMADDPPLLVCSGSTSTAHGPALMQQVAATEVGQRVRFLGYCPREDMPALFAGAEALVFCSLHEGFGMPVIEAMRMGCPVIAANTTSLPEVAGNAAILVDPLDADAIAAAVLRLRADPALRRFLTAAGTRQAARFSWQRHCTEIVSLLHSCSGRASPGEGVRRAGSGLRQAARGGAFPARFRQSVYPVLRRRLIATLPRGPRSLARILS
jgi:glycosyltransferase involved in cell wall biosynthesis